MKTVPHVAFEVDDLSAALAGHKVIIQPNSPSEGLLVAFVEVNGAPVELMQYINKPNPHIARVPLGFALFFDNFNDM